MACKALILAAGLGTRMKSSTPKVLHALAGRPLLQWSLLACRRATGAAPTIVVGPEAEQIREAVGDEAQFVEQAERLGTGHAVLQAADALQEKADLILVTNADMPLLSAETLEHLIDRQRENDGPLTMLVANSDRGRGFGRVLRDGRGRVTAIIEAAHATSEQLTIQELNVGAYCFQAAWLWEHLPRLEKSPKGEYYLTDLVALAVNEGADVQSVQVEDLDEVIGVNTRVHLAEAEAAVQRRLRERFMLAGVSLPDPSCVYLHVDVAIGQDAQLLPNTHLLGQTSVGAGSVIGPNTIVRDSQIGKGCQIQASVIEGAVLRDHVHVGPFAHLRRGALLEDGVHMGNFGEVKNSRLGPSVKMGHFSYVGDADVGEGTNIGAGTITCNFDGERKNRTEIGEDVFVGSDTMLVAPVKLGKGARTGAGSVVTRDVPDHGLAVGVPARVIRILEESDEGDH